MKILFIGGTGTISSEITKQLASMNHEIYLINRGNHNENMPKNVHFLLADINDEKYVESLIKSQHFDVVADFIAFTEKQVERDYRLFRDKCSQYIFISSASAYQKPPKSYIITEKTPLDNPFWEYSRNKAACEKYLLERFFKDDFPVTIVRPSHTYGDKSVPVALHGDKGSFQVIKRIAQGKSVIIPGDGESLWTLTHNTDFAPLFISLMGNKKTLGQAYNIMSGEALTWNMIYKTIAATIGVELNPLYVTSTDIVNIGKIYGYDFEGGLLGDKTNSVVFDISKVKAFMPEYKLKMPFAKGVKHALDYIRDHEELHVSDDDFDIFCDDMEKIIKR